MSDQPIPCACGGFWPNDHVAGCTNEAMARLWPKAYRRELEQRRTSGPTERERIEMCGNNPTDLRVGSTL